MSKLKIQTDADQEVTEAKQARACRRAHHDCVLEDRDAMEHHPHHLIVQSLQRVCEKGSDQVWIHEKYAIYAQYAKYAA